MAAAPPGTPTAAPVPSGSYRVPGTFNVERSPLKRKAPNPGWGGSTGDDSSVTFDARAFLIDKTNLVRDQKAVKPMATLEMDAGHSGHLRFFLTIEGFQDNLAVPIAGGNDSFTQEVEGLWEVSADNKGVLKIVGAARLDGPSSNDTDYSVQPLTQSIDPVQGVVVINVLVTGKGVQTSGTTSVGGEVDIKKGKGSLGYERNTTKQTGPASVHETFTIQIKVVNIPKEPPPPDPKGTVTVHNVVTAIVDDEFVIGPFVTKNKTKLDSRSGFNPGQAKHLKAASVQEAVHSLFYALPQSTRDSLANGKLAGDEAGVGMKIEIHGYASNTDTATRNFDLSFGRAEAVHEAFKKLGVPAEVFQPPHPHGEWLTRNDKGMEPTDDKRRQKESADWRKVVIKIRYTVTTEVEP